MKFESGKKRRSAQGSSLQARESMAQASFGWGAPVRIGSDYRLARPFGFKMNVSTELFPGVPLIESPLFKLALDDLGLSDAERDIAIQLNEKGFAVLDFPDEGFDDRAERIKSELSPYFDIDLASKDTVKNKGDMRIQDGWQMNADIKAIACNQSILELLSKLYGRKAFPFQTLNFPVGTQQHMHNDAVHFYSVPEKFMCGVWVALEDITADAGPLLYYPGSHKWPMIFNDQIGMTGAKAREKGSAQRAYEKAWRAMAEATGAQPETFCARKGQALIWSSNLLHGGSPQNDLTLTRWSQVTHYYFENCSYYTPAFSDPFIGKLDLRTRIRNISTGEIMPNLYDGQPLHALQNENAITPEPVMGGPEGVKSAKAELPKDFDAKRYYMFNADVAAAGVDAAEHYILHGAFENRRYR